MFVSKNNFYISPEEYLEGERVSPIKHEYRRGHVYAMTGAKKPHIVISVSISKSEIKIECFRLNAEGNWVSQTYRQGDRVEFVSANFSCAISEIYQKAPGIIL